MEKLAGLSAEVPLNGFFDREPWLCSDGDMALL